VGTFAGIIEWDNGITKSEATWLTVLTHGAAHGTWDNRRELADAVRRDATGYQRLLTQVPPAEHSYFATLHARITAPQHERVTVDARAADADLFLTQMAAVRCNLA